MLLINSMFWPDEGTRATSEVSWFLSNYCLMNLYVFVLAIGQALWLMATFEGTIPGWTGSPLEQVAWYAIAVVLFTSLSWGFRSSSPDSLPGERSSGLQAIRGCRRPSSSSQWPGCWLRYSVRAPSPST
jgi:hypothetical protein